MLLNLDLSNSAVMFVETNMMPASVKSVTIVNVKNNSSNWKVIANMVYGFAQKNTHTLTL